MARERGRGLQSGGSATPRPPRPPRPPRSRGTTAASRTSGGAADGESKAPQGGVDPDLHERLVSKLQESTNILMVTQTQLNDAENKIGVYKRQMSEWLLSARPSFRVEGKKVDGSGGFIQYHCCLLQRNASAHEFTQRYSEFDKFRAALKRKLLLKSSHVVRLPGLPPKVWGRSRSASPAVVKDREAGIAAFLNIMVALGELSEIVGEEFFDWIGWRPKHMQEGEGTA